MDITRTHPSYGVRASRLGFALSHYRGDLYETVTLTAPGDASPRSALGLKGSPFLLKHEQGESDAAYAERRAVSTYTPHYAFAVDSLAGQVQAAEDDSEREWDGSPLGDPEDESSAMYGLWRDADGKGLDWPTLWATLAPNLITATEWFVFVEGATPEAPHGRVCLIDPRHVIDWHEEGGRLAWAVVKEDSYAEREPGEDAVPVVRYLALLKDGWVRYEQKAEQAAEKIDEGDYAYADASGVDIVPARFIRLPLGRDLGYQMAHVANGLLNRQSTRDWRFWTACVNRLHLDMGDDRDTSIKDMVQLIRDNGQSLLFTRGGGSAEYINPSQEPAIAAGESLKDDIKAFYHTFFRAYADAARQTTATEIRQQNDTGGEAFLVMLAQTLDEAENFALMILEQVASGAKGATPRARVKRSTSYQPVLPEEQAASLADRYFTGAVPVGEKGLVSVAERIAKLDGITVDADELEAEVQGSRQRPAVREDRLARLREGQTFQAPLAGGTAPEAE